MPWLEGDFVEYTPPRLDDEQIVALEDFIVASKNATNFAKRVILWTLSQTDNLTKQVALSVWDKDWSPKLTKQVQDGAHDMLSCNGTTRLDLFMAAMDTEMRLVHHYGCFVPSVDKKDPFQSHVLGITIWFAYIFYTREVKILPAPCWHELEKIELLSSYEKANRKSSLRRI